MGPRATQDVVAKRKTLASSEKTSFHYWNKLFQLLPVQENIINDSLPGI
jgi:hypothetical protein